jgi:paraquat-inducible protein A
MGPRDIATAPGDRLANGARYFHGGAMGNNLGYIMTLDAHRNSIRKIGRKRDKALGPLMGLCAAAWVAGLVMPLMTVEKVFVFVDTHSIASIMLTLIAESEWVLFALIFLFSVVMPVVKFDQLYRVWFRFDVSGASVDKAQKRIDAVSKWSMGDVFVVAVIVVIFKTSGVLADARIEPGLYVFAASVVGSMAVTVMLRRAVMFLRRD